MRARFHPVSTVHMDTIACVGSTERPGVHWKQVKAGKPHWKAGEWNVYYPGPGGFRAQAEQSACWQEQISMTHLLAGLETEERDCGQVERETRVTRVDFCVDVVGLAVRPELEHYFTGHRKERFKFEHSSTGSTLCIGSRESECYLRIYEKHIAEKAGPAFMQREWQHFGWAGEDVTRIEFELKRRAVERATKYGRLEAWCDSLARLRMLERPRFEYADAKGRIRASRGRTDPDWSGLGVPLKCKLDPLPDSTALELLLRTTDQMKRRAQRMSMSMESLCESMLYLANGAHVSDDLRREGIRPDYEVILPHGERIQFASQKGRPRKAKPELGEIY
jgi:hypothetical protein